MNHPLNTELRLGEFHPMAPGAFQFIKAQGPVKLMMAAEALASSALSGNRTAEICWGTLDRILTGQPVSDRYALGLAWFMQSAEQDPIRPLETVSHELAKALRDALSTFRDDDKTTIITGERKEAWSAALANYDRINRPVYSKKEGQE